MVDPKIIYLDNAATSWPKPPEVLKAMIHVLEYAGGNPGRSGHTLSIRAARIIYEAREDIATFFHASEPLRVIFTSNVTHSLNIILNGLLRHGDKVVTSSMEHNSVMRPLRLLERKGIELSIIPCSPDGTLNIRDATRIITPRTRLVVINHASNVVGTILPIADIAAIAHRAGALLLVDAAQTAGSLPIDVQTMGIDFLAFTGHKSLMGPPGIGGFIIGDKVDVSQIEALMSGGTGSQSELEEHPKHLPDKFESGTPNTVGIAGLHAGIGWIKERGSEAIRQHELECAQALINGLSNIRNIKIHGTKDPTKSIAVVSFTFSNLHVSDIGLRLDEEYGVLTRVGLHCAPAAHKTIGTFPEGTVRLAPGIFTSMDDINNTVLAINRIAES
jgi:cysteine desulfurase/selenocysteine lyase